LVQQVNWSKQGPKAPVISCITKAILFSALNPSTPHYSGLSSYSPIRRFSYSEKGAATAPKRFIQWWTEPADTETRTGEVGGLSASHTATDRLSGGSH